MPKLRTQNLSEIASSGIPVPTYDRSAVRIGIVHVGVGGFHRAHQAMYLDALMNQGEALDWGICGVGVLPHDAHMRDVMHDQDCLYTLTVKPPQGEPSTRVIGSIVDYLFAPDDAEAVLKRMADPATRIVSMTITEGGYNINDITGEFDPATPAVVADLQPGAVPSTVFGLVTEALARRRQRGVEPFTIMSCDNVQGNGDVARRVFGAFATLKDAELGAWVAQHVHFPNCMVDRITPATTDEDRAEVAFRTGIEDGWPVVSEPFTQWVLEDDFGMGRPSYELAGVQLVEEVAPYELMKLRLLNAGHQLLSYFSYLMGHRYVHDACQDPLLQQYFRDYMVEEGQPSLQPVPGIDLAAYQQQLVERFSNPHIKDTIARIGTDTSDRIPKWLLPVVSYQLAHGGPLHRSVATVAAWARYAEAVDEQGEPIEVNDRLRDQLVATAQRQAQDPSVFVRDRDLFGDLADNERFLSLYLAVLASLHERGARVTLEDVVAGKF